MTKWLRLAMVLGGLGLLAPDLPAAEKPAADAGPALTAQLQPLGKLLDDLRQAADRLSGGKGGARELDAQIEKLLGRDGFKGIDPKRPIGLVADIKSAAVPPSPTVMVPITTEEEFRGLLQRLSAKVEASKDGVSRVTLPQLPVELAMRIHEKVAYFSMTGQAVADPKRLPNPATVLVADQPGVALVRLRLDRLPEAVTKQVRSHLADFGKLLPPENAGELEAIWLRFVRPLLQMANRWTEQVFLEGREATVRLDLDPKVCEPELVFTLAGKPGSPLAAQLAARKPTRNAFASLIGADSAGSVLFQVPLSTLELRTAAEGVLKVAGEQLGKGIPDEFREVFAELFRAAERTVRADEIALGTDLRGPDKDGRFTAVAGLTLRQTAAFEKAWRLAMHKAPAEARARFRFAVETVGDVSIHHFTPPEGILPPGAGQAFGKGPVRFAFAPNSLLFSFGPDGLAAMRSALAAKPADAPLVQAQVSVKRLLALTEKIDAGTAKQMQAYFPKDVDQLTPLRLSIEGGKALTVRFRFSALLLPRTAASTAPAPPPKP